MAGSRASRVGVWAVVLVSALLGALTYRGHYRWVGHALLATAGLAALGWIMTSGATLTRRLPGPVRGAFPLHRTQGIAFATLMLLSLPYGLLSVERHGEPYFSSAHGKLGVLIAILGLAQVVPSLLTLKRARLRLPHRIIGYLLPVLLLLQTITGLEHGVMGVESDLVFGHTLLGATALVAGLWIVVEMRYPGVPGLKRAEVAAWAAAAANLAGCWLLGGSYYLGEYVIGMSRHVLDSARPWAVSVALATKLQVFLFLPVTSLVLALALSSLRHYERLPVDEEARRVVTGLSLLNVGLVVLVAALGILVADAGRIAG